MKIKNMYLRTEEMVGFEEYIQWLRENIRQYYADLVEEKVKFEVPQDRSKHQKKFKGGTK